MYVHVSPTNTHNPPPTDIHTNVYFPLHNNTIQLFRVSDPSWKCTLSEGAAVGLTSALWAPDGRHVLTVGE